MMGGEPSSRCCILVFLLLSTDAQVFTNHIIFIGMKKAFVCLFVLVLRANITQVQKGLIKAATPNCWCSWLWKESTNSL